ncbi:EamA family transporter [Niallia sp. XMNu-256]|uniref:DMT family transporter n=1 Tax=Niallia sp. XMNu-256 TaxID=3082444 RepID=UPI0030CC5BC8
MGSYIKILLGAGLWGFIAIFVKELATIGFSEMEIVALRVGWAAIFLLLIGLMRKGSIQPLKKPRDMIYFVGTGIVSIVFFNWCYFKAMNEMNISLAVILLYTSPVFVTILSYLLLKEGMNKKKVISVFGTILGCGLIAGIGSGSLDVITPLGVIVGLGSGFFYALYSIFSKFALKTYHSFAITFYTFLFAIIFLVPITQLWNKWELIINPQALLYSTGLGLIPTVVAFLLYTSGLNKVDSSKAAILSTVEPLIATLLGVLMYHEKLSMVQLFGSLLIVASFIIVQLPSRRNPVRDMKTMGI